MITPGGEGTIFIRASMAVVLPAPVSPTSPRVLFRSVSDQWRLTASTVSSEVTYFTTRFSTSTARSVVSRILSSPLIPVSLSAKHSFHPPYRFIFGSSASLRPSPTRLITITVIIIARPGNRHICCALIMNDLDALNSAPHIRSRKRHAQSNVAESCCGDNGGSHSQRGLHQNREKQFGRTCCSRMTWTGAPIATG